MRWRAHFVDLWATTQFISSGGQIWLEAVGGTTTATYTYGNGLVRKDSEYFQYDGLGSARTITNGSQTVTGTATYEGFGATIATTGSSASPYLFAATSGYRNDNDAGLMHIGARYYDAQVGRFITRDTELDQHPFLYCGHNPINLLDPSGHLPTWAEMLTIGGAVVGTFISPGLGTAIGAGVGRVIGGLIDGEHPVEAVGNGLVIGGLTFVGGVLVGEIALPSVGALGGKVAVGAFRPPAVILPLIRTIPKAYR